MKKVFIATLAFMALSTYSVNAQTSEINQRIKNERGVLLIGQQNMEPFNKKPFKAWYDEEYTPYVVDQPSIKNWKKKIFLLTTSPYLLVHGVRIATENFQDLSKYFRN
jgi:hypothetical protein